MKKITKKVLSIILMITVLCSAPLSITAAAGGAVNNNYQQTGEKTAKLLKVTLSEGATGTFVLDNEITFNNGQTCVINEIGDGAFKDLVGLKGVILTENVTKLGAGIIEGCTNIKSMTIPSSVVTAGSDDTGAFFGSSIEELVFSEGMTAVPALICRDCTTLKKVTLPSTVTEISEKAFLSARSLSDINLPDGLQRIEQFGLAGTAITNLELPDSVTYIGPGAFVGCTSLESVKLSSNIKTIHGEAFYGCTKLKEITIPKTLELAYSAMLSYGAFEGSSIEKATIEDGMKIIPVGIFNNCKTLQSVVIPATVTAIGTNAFNGTDALSDIYFCGTEAQWNNIYFEGTSTALNNSNINIHYNYVPGMEEPELPELNYSFEFDMGSLYISGTGDIEQSDSYGWEINKDSIVYVEFALGITSVPDDMFNGYSALREVYFGKDIKTVGESAFANCTQLKTVSFAGNTTFPDNAFKNASPELFLSCYQNNTNAIDYAERNGIHRIEVAYNETNRLLSFSGDILTDSNSNFNFINNYLIENSDVLTVYFSKIIYTGNEPDYSDMLLNIDGIPIVTNCDAYENQRTNMYVTIIVSENGTERNLSYYELLNLIIDDSTEEVCLRLKSDEHQEEKVTFFQKIVNFFTAGAKTIKRILATIKGWFN